MTHFFGSFPTQGVWTSVGLNRLQFVGVVIVSTLLFVLIDGPIWQHVHSSHLLRIGWSYAVIPVLTATALKRNDALTLGHLLGATVLLSMIKLVLTAAILIALEMAKFTAG